MFWQFATFGRFVACYGPPIATAGRLVGCDGVGFVDVEGGPELMATVAHLTQEPDLALGEAGYPEFLLPLLLGLEELG